MKDFEKDLLCKYVQCKAKSKRTGLRCKARAMNGMLVCYHHGGVLGSKIAKEARRQAVLKEGNFTKEAIAERKELSKMVKDSRQYLSGF